MDTQLKYVPTGVVVAEQSLEQFTGFQSRGLNAAQIYAEKIRPRLSQPQSLVAVALCQLARAAGNAAAYMLPQ